jgi:hypothetical protein
MRVIAISGGDGRIENAMSGFGTSAMYSDDARSQFAIKGPDLGQH